MIIKAKKYGNSRVLPIPKAIWDLFGMQVDKTEFLIKTENNQLVIRTRPNIPNILDKLDEKYHQTFENLAK